MTHAIEARGLSRSFGPVKALDGLSFEVAHAELFGLVGPDGAGKTTAMRILAGIMRPSAGECRVEGLDAASEPEKVKEEIGYMSQRFGLYADLTVDENLRFYADLFGVGRAEREERAARLLGFSGLLPFRGRYAGNLSGGMKQKLGLACALIHKPKVLLLDEPTNGVDPVSRKDFWRILDGLRREGVTIFVSTSYLDEAERCDRVGLLHRGRLLACAAPAEIRRTLGGRVTEVRAADPRAAARALKTALGSSAVGLMGDRVHAAAGEEEVRRALADAGVEPSDVRPVESTLEDVFVSVLGAGAEDEADAGI